MKARTVYTVDLRNGVPRLRRVELPATGLDAAREQLAKLPRQVADIDARLRRLESTPPPQQQRRP